MIPTSISKNSNSNGSSVIFKITASGTMTNIVQFTRVLESSNYLVQINSLKIKKLEQNNIGEDIIPNELVHADFLIEVISK